MKELKKRRVTIPFYGKQCLPDIFIMEKNYSSKQIVPITYKLEKKVFLQLLILKVYRSFFLRQIKGDVLHNLVCVCLLSIFKRNQAK